MVTAVPSLSFSSTCQSRRPAHPCTPLQTMDLFAFIMDLERAALQHHVQLSVSLGRTRSPCRRSWSLTRYEFGYHILTMMMDSQRAAGC